MVETAVRSRSFGGCGTCRARHIKCDETRPGCRTCVTYNLTCDGYNRTIFFDTEGQDDGKARYRQVLFTDEERERMSFSMTDKVPFSKTLTVVADIDSQCEEAARISECGINIFRGPFGAFKLDMRPPPAEELPLSDDVITSFSPRNSLTFDISNPELFHLPDWLDTSSLLADYDGNGMMPLSPSRRSPTPQLLQDHHRQSINLFEDILDIRIWRQPTTSIGMLAGTSVLQEAPSLLKHYANNFIPSLTPYRHTKTPWHVLFLPNAKHTLASIAIGEEVDAADLTTFLGTLSISAISLHNHSSGSRWQAYANLLKRQASDSVQIVISRALERPKIFKYKSTIMAILAMVQVSMGEGDWDETDKYLLEAEKVIRLRGLAKNTKSRKVRILHHCYGYMRIFHESLSLISARSHLRHTITTTIRSSGVLVKGSDLPSFKLVPWDDLDAKFREIKTREQGENDLHLGSPGHWPSTLYPEIYGIPEAWLNLLSQVIRLANEKDAPSSNDGQALPLKEFTRRAKALESYILKRKDSITPSMAIESVQIVEVDWIFLESMQSALQHALIIYFYRRIYDVHPDILQSKVRKVRDILFVCKQLCDSGGFLDALMWPAFIAGCEALDTALQQSFSDWFQYSTQYRKKSSFERMHQLMHRVWNTRQRDDKKATSWLHLLRSHDAPP